MIRPNSKHTEHRTQNQFNTQKLKIYPELRKKKSKTNPQSSRLRERIHKKKKKSNTKQRRTKPIP
jgi:hypothetical protein